MMDIPETPSSVDEGEAAFVGGAIRQQLGLTRLELRVGLDVARNQMERQAFGEALRTYVGLVLCDPAVADFQVGLANCAIQLGEYHLALQAASAVVALAPGDARGFLLSGRACLGLGQMAEAGEDLRDAVRAAQAAGQTAIVQEASALLLATSREIAPA